jgi:hypothetical protein
MALEKIPHGPGEMMVKYIIILISKVVRRPHGIIRWYGLPEDGESLIHKRSSLFIKVNVSM